MATFREIWSFYRYIYPIFPLGSEALGAPQGWMGWFQGILAWRAHYALSGLLHCNCVDTRPGYVKHSYGTWP